MKLLNKTILGFVGMFLMMSFFSACTDKIAFGNSFLEKAPGGSVTKDTVFNSAVYTEQFLNSIYALQYYGLPYTVKNGTSASPYTGKLDQVTDCWLMHWNTTTAYNAYYTGTLDSGQDPLISFSNDNVWRAVRAAYLLIENVDNVPDLSDDKKASFKAQAKCLIAARYFDLFAEYGGLPLVKQSYSGTEGSYNLPRASVDSTVVFMTGLLDDAINSNALRWAYDGNTTETDSTNNIGRWTKAGAMALKAKILTYAASPLFNDNEPYYQGMSEEQKPLVWYGDYSEERWQKALKACQDFFNACNSNGWYHLTTCASLGLSKSHDHYRQAYRKGYAAQGSHEIIHSTRVLTTDAYKAAAYTWHYWQTTPPRSNCLPTEEYIEMFPWSDGTPFNWKKDSLAGKIVGANGRLFYRVTTGRFGKKTASRDPRLYEECIVNGQQKSLDWTTGKSNGDIYELWVGGQDASNYVAAYDEKAQKIVVNESLVKRFASGYDNNKYFMENDYLRQYTQWVYLSLDEMYLLYAECLAQTGNLKDAIAQVDVVRSRVGLNSLGKAVPAVKTDKDTFMEELFRERACELGLTNARYHDMVRYKRGDWMVKPLHGIITYRLEKNVQGEWTRAYRPWIGNDKNNGMAEPSRFDYDKFEIKNMKRYWWGKDPKSNEITKWFLWPFPQTEINKGYGLIQNPGW